MRMTRIALAAVLAVPMALNAQEPVDQAAIGRIRAEAFERSQIMDIASWLTDVYGPRLTNSPITTAAAHWTLQQLTSWGLSNPRTEAWGPFGRGWTNERTAIQVTAPVAFPVIGYPSAWTPGTNGRVSGAVVLIRADSAADLVKYHGKLKGAIVMTEAPRPVPAWFSAPGSRLSDEQMEKMAAAEPTQPGGGGPGGPPANLAEQRQRFQAQQAFATERTNFLVSEGAVAVLQQARGDGGTVFVSGGGGSRDAANPARLPIVAIAVEHYGRIARILDKGVPVTMDLEVQNSFHDASPNSFNILAEIPGTDKQDEVVMLGAHFDSWHSGTGATDNAAGSAVMLEAVRILKALNLPMRRTVRIGLWTGEEQGLLGSRAYVREQFGTGDSAKAANGKVSGYFNVDNGTGAIRGVYLQGNAGVGPIFQTWMGPFADKGMQTLTLSNTGGTDHLAFDAVGIPGFQFIQDAVEYSTRTHHSSQDTWERLQEDDMKLNAAVVAAFVYLTANRADMLPRKPVTLTP
ncbi:MAG: M20/M25/M40 family metallo-hydrolase [Gemmatimonadota bacterium]